MSQKTVLFILSSADKTLDGKSIGWYLPEAAHPYYAIRPHYKVEFASPKGGAPPIDHTSVENFKDEESVKFINTDEEAKKLVADTKEIKNVKAEDYVAIFVVGGHGPMIDLAFDKDMARLVEEFYAAKKPVSAVCHGTAALTLATKPGSTESILNGVTATGFSNSEEDQTPYADYVKTLPFSLEDKIGQVGGKYVKAGDWASKVVYDGGILTGQNPASASDLGKKLVEILQSA